MNKFVARMCESMGIPPTMRLNCSMTPGTLIDETMFSFRMTMPDGTLIEIYTPKRNSGPTDTGYAYLPDYDVESPDMQAEELGDWADQAINCCRRIDAFYDRLKQSKLNSSLDDSDSKPELGSLDLDAGRENYSEDAMSPEENQRAKNVFNAAIEGVDLPSNFRYQGMRTSPEGEYIVRTLQVYSAKIQQWKWVAKSGLQLVSELSESDTDAWGFVPVYRPPSEGGIVKDRPTSSVRMDSNLYQTEIQGDTPEQRDKRAAYWLVGILSDMIDSAVSNPPTRVYEFFLSAGIAGFSKETIMQMEKKGIYRCIEQGYLDPEKVLKARPDLARDLVTKHMVPAEVVARRAPEQLLWLVTQGLISPDYALKINPELSTKLAKKGLYEAAEGLPDTAEEILSGVADGTITPVSAYRKNPKLLQPMVEQKLITPQEAYKLDPSIVTWLLLNHYIGREEATKVKPDVKQYIQKRYKDTNWEDLDAGKDGPGPIDKLKSAFKKHQKSAKKADSAFDKFNDEAYRKAAQLRQAAGLNSSKGFQNLNSGISEDLEAEAPPTPVIEGTELVPGYEMLQDTNVEGPGFVAECMLPEDDFEGIIVPGDTEEIAKETLMQMLLANDGTFVDWKPVPDIQTFKSENADGNFLVLN